MIEAGLASRIRLADACVIKAKKSEIAESNPFFLSRVYWLVVNGVCSSYEEVVSHADR